MIEKVKISRLNESQLAEAVRNYPFLMDYFCPEKIATMDMSPYEAKVHALNELNQKNARHGRFASGVPRIEMFPNYYIVHLEIMESS